MDRTGPGTLLAGRYRLQEQVSADDVTALWRAEDLTLERPVAVRVLSATHARVQSTLDAARRAALVDDVRLQRVFGVGVEGGTGYVVLEWITGQDAAALAGNVSEREALRLVREVAESLRTAAARQLHHGRLGPRQVVRASDGRVRVVGTGIDVAAAGQATPAAAARPETRDVRDLSAVLYALLTGAWPFGAAEGLPPAPTEKGRPVGPRALRGDVSPRLDALLAGVLAGTGPDTLDGLLQALQTVGDDDAAARPAAPRDTGAPPATRAAAAAGGVVAGAAAGAAGAAAAAGGAGAAVGAAGAARPAAGGAGDAAGAARPAAASGDTDVLSPVAGTGGASGAAGAGTATAGPAGLAGGAPAAGLAGTAAAGLAAAAGTAGAAGAVGAVGAAGAAGVAAAGPSTPRPDARPVAAHRTVAPARTPAPTSPYPVQPDPAQPDAADAQVPAAPFSRGSATRAPAAPAGYASRAPVYEEDDGWDLLPVGEQPWDEQGWEAAQPWDESRQPWDDDPWDPQTYADDHPGAAGSVLPAAAARRGSRRPAGAGSGVAVVLVMGAFVVGTLVWALDRVQDGDDVAAPVPQVTETVQASPEPSVVAPPPPPPPSDAPVLVSPAGVQALDPQGDGEENDQDAPRAIDGDPASAWETQRYNSQDFGRLKTGLGLAFDLGAPADVGSVTITAPGAGGTYEVRAATGPGYDGSTVIATGETGDAPSVLAPETPVTTQFVVVWFTSLPQIDGEFRAAVSEVQVQVP